MTNTYRLKQVINNQILEYTLDKCDEYGVLEIFLDTIDGPILKEELLKEFKLTDIIVKEVFEGKKTIISGECPEKITVTENDIKFIVHLKNDFIGLDLSKVELRNLIQTYSKNKNVLDVFGHTGEMSLYATKGNAAGVSTVEFDQKYIQIIKKNFEINSMELPQIWDVKYSDIIELAIESRTKWDLIIVDLSDYNLERNPEFNLLTDHKELIKTLQERVLKDAGILIVVSDNKSFVLDQYIRPGADKLTNKLIPATFEPLKTNQVFAFYN